MSVNDFFTLIAFDHGPMLTGMKYGWRGGGHGPGRPTPDEPSSPPAGSRTTPGTPAIDQDAASFQRELVAQLTRGVGRHPEDAAPDDWFRALAHLVRGRLAEGWVRSRGLARDQASKTVYYLSMEFLIGRSLATHLFNLGLTETCREALEGLGIEPGAVYACEADAALGNGGLGRLAACFMESLTSQGYPACGYGIRYDAGMFRQRIVDGWQVEEPDDWLRHGNPWEFADASATATVAFGGHTGDGQDSEHRRWTPDHEVLALAHDLQVSGLAQPLVNTIRLWSARSAEAFDLRHFNEGDHELALRAKAEAENLSRVLYPGDASDSGRELRLRQEHFFVSASLQDILARHAEDAAALTALAERVAIQLNDTHPALAIAEMMRLLIDERGLGWDAAWAITRGCFAYTNHTLQPEALETWPIDLFARVLPRHLEIVFRINEAFLADVRARVPGDEDLVRRVSLIGENGERHLRMAHLAIVGSHAVNGVSELHTAIMRGRTFADFERLFPGRIRCRTNGITTRRWLAQANPGLASLVSARIDRHWLVAPESLERLAAFADDQETQARFRAVKEANKRRLAARLRDRFGFAMDAHALLDVQIKRIHEYKRQLLNVLHVVARYDRLCAGADAAPRTVLFAGKAAAGYHAAKLVIKLINDVAATVNRDPAVRGLLRVVFVPDYDVSAAEEIIPAAELSEQISTAGTEASGTGNMKLALNGALTIGTRDGANVEIGARVGEDNIFFFGLTADEVAARRAGGYDPWALYRADDELANVLDMIGGGFFSPDDRARFRPLVDGLLRR